LMRFRRKEPVETLDEIKEKHKQKYIPPFFNQQLLDKWGQMETNGTC